ncbi:thioredoxin-like fold motif-containing protein [Pandoravirus inopinatum]|uniref:Thioredoxin-like fold motif-containing protein n=1 Tax=Pandoravirus inopinatum TaxID=1605721 RepID=A0A0B5J365_9VIRU|nr:thioredoxin-like fold motif-containing protein [Pandoravirus inopinatum]AJF98039.1 thioredoxin-like fold motif-containing protein [Pandoravirus inopinatum]
MQRTTTTRIYSPRGTGLCGLAAAPAPVIVGTAAPALSPCAAAAALRAQSAANAAAANNAAAAAAADAGTVLVAAPGHHHHHHADVPVRKDCGFPWWVVLVLVLGMILLGVWLWLRNRGRDGANGGKAIIIGPAAPPRSPVVPPVVPPMSPVLPPASPVIIGGGGGGANGRPGSPVMAPLSPAYSPVMIQTPAAPAGQAVRPYGLVPLGTATKVTGDQVRADIEAGNPALVMYTSHGCYYCDQALPEIQKAAANLGVPVLIVDREDLAPADRPDGYPSIYAIAGPGDTRLFNGDRTAESFVRFVAQHLGMHYVRPGCL